MIDFKDIPKYQNIIKHTYKNKKNSQPSDLNRLSVKLYMKTKMNEKLRSGIYSLSRFILHSVC